MMKRLTHIKSTNCQSYVIKNRDWVESIKDLHIKQRIRHIEFQSKINIVMNNKNRTSRKVNNKSTINKKNL